MTQREERGGRPKKDVGNQPGSKSNRQLHRLYGESTELSTTTNAKAGWSNKFQRVKDKPNRSFEGVGLSGISIGCLCVI